MKLSNYRFRCITEGCYKTQWRCQEAGAPTKCFVSESHVIDRDSIVILEEMDNSAQNVLIKQYELIDPLIASTSERGYELEIHTNDVFSECVCSFDYNVDIVAGYMFDVGSQVGDHVEAAGMLKNDAPACLITENALAGQNKVKVTDLALPSIRAGLYVCLGKEAETNPDTHEYEVIAADQTTYELTLAENLLFNRYAGDTVRIYKKSLNKRFIYPEHEMKFGNLIFEASGMPKENQLRFRYFHKTPPVSDRTAYCTLVYRF